MASRALGRLVELAHSARAYLAGFGTSGSLLAVAALLFIVAGAMVAFRGWPHVGAQPAPGEVVVSPRPTAATGSVIARRLAVIAATPAGAVGAPGGAVAGAGLRGGGPLGPPGGALRSIGQPVSTSRPAPVAVATQALPAVGSSPCCATLAAPAPTVPAPTPAVPPVPAPLTPVSQTVGQATGALGGVVSSTGTQAGSVVGQTSGTVGSAVQPVSPAAAGAVNSVGSGAAQTVTGVTQTIAGTLSGIGGQ